MKNKAISFHRQQAMISKQDYRPSLNVFRFFRAIIGIFIFGQSASLQRVYNRK